MQLLVLSSKYCVNVSHHNVLYLKALQKLHALPLMQLNLDLHLKFLTVRNIMLLTVRNQTDSIYQRYNSVKISKQIAIYKTDIRRNKYFSYFYLA